MPGVWVSRKNERKYSCILMKEMENAKPIKQRNPFFGWSKNLHISSEEWEILKTCKRKITINSDQFVRVSQGMKGIEGWLGSYVTSFLAVERYETFLRRVQSVDNYLVWNINLVHREAKVTPLKRHPSNTPTTLKPPHLKTATFRPSFWGELLKGVRVYS